MNIRKDLFCALALAALVVPRWAVCQDHPRSDDEEAQLRALLAEETEVATKTKMNSDFVPGIVTVLDGDDLEALGVETAWEALSFVPGMLPVLDANGNPSAIIRGLTFPFNFKILIDSVPLSRESSGINGIALLIPIQQVDRIEVIRGPGSVVYGDLAFLGFVNIVTRRNGQRGFFREGGDHALSGGASLDWRMPNTWEISVEGAGLKNDDAPVAEPSSGDEKRGWGQVFLRRGGVSLTAEGITRRLDRSSPQGPLTDAQSHVAFQGRYASDPAAGLHSELHAGYLHNRFSNPMTEFRGAVFDAGLDLTWTGWRRHSVLVGIGFQNGTIDDAEQHVRQPIPPQQQPPPGLTVHDRHRNVFGVTLQDTFEISSAFAMTAGGRYDRFTDIGERFTPRVSLVWRASDKHILKLQYAEGYRSPTFFELYSGGYHPDLKPEIDRTWELNYVFRRPLSVVRLTIFRSRIDDLIYLDAGPPPAFSNRRRARASGVEAEWEQKIATRLEAAVNVSYVDADDERNPSGGLMTPNSAVRWLGNLALLYRAGPSTRVGIHWNHAGRRHGPASTDTSGYDLVDLTVTQRDVFVPGLQLRAGVKNAFDSDVRYLTPVRPNAPDTVLNFPGRTYFAEIAWIH